VKPILLDGSNVSLSGSGGGKLTSLATLSQMIHCLLANGFKPYTIFDASFKHRISESSVGRRDFNHLTKHLSEYFQMSPAGEEADLFLLQLALELQCPVVSNDTFKKYGKVMDNRLQYEGFSVHVYNYQMIAGVVVLPDLKIRRRVGVDERDPFNIEGAFSSPPPEVISPMNTNVQGKREKSDQTVLTPRSCVSDDEMRVISRVISRFENGGSVGGIQNLSRRLNVHRNQYLKRNGLTDKSELTWFGFAKLSDFLDKQFPNHKTVGSKTDPKK
jgi:Zc3h12a-like Ribonuclease NYN domain